MPEKRNERERALLRLPNKTLHSMLSAKSSWNELPRQMTKEALVRELLIAEYGRADVAQPTPADQVRNFLYERSGKIVARGTVGRFAIESWVCRGRFILLQVFEDGGVQTFITASDSIKIDAELGALEKYLDQQVGRELGKGGVVPAIKNSKVK